MKGLAGLLPWAVALLVVAGAIWFLYDRHIAAGRWVFVLLLIGHGSVHLLYLAPAPPVTAGGPGWPFGLDAGPLGGALGLGPAYGRILAFVLIGAVVALFSLAGLSAAGLLVPEAWWPSLTVAGSILSLVLLIMWFDPQLLAGVSLDLVLIWLAALTTWRPQLV